MQSSATRCPIRRPPSIRTAATPSPNPTCSLVFFSDSSHAIGHVGIYIGNGQIIHARYSVGKITIDSLSASYYASRYVGAKRIA